MRPGTGTARGGRTMTGESGTGKTRLRGRRSWAPLVAATVVVVVVAGLAGSGAHARTIAPACVPPPEHLGLDAYAHIDKLSYLDLGSRAASATTADPGGSNDDRSHVLGDPSGAGRVLMDAAGP